ncbi:hypothetical protein [Escherichia coli]|nr:hypothetical protein [Escherichia coli]
MAFIRKYVTCSDDSPRNYHIMPPQEILQETEKRQELHESIPKTCKLKALDAQQGGLFGVDKDEWVFPDNKSFYLPEKYRPENRITELAMMKEG